MLSTTNSLNDVKAELETYDFYAYATSGDLDTAVTTALANVQYNYMIPQIGWGAYGEIRDLNRTLFDDATCDTTNNDETVTMNDSSNVVEDMYVYGVGVPDGVQVDSVTNSTTIELTQKATADGTNVTLTFNRLTQSQYWIYRAEVNFAIAEFYLLHARQELYTRKASTESITESGIDHTTSGLIGKKMVAREYIERGKADFRRAGERFTKKLQRGDSTFYLSDVNGVY